MDRHGKFRVAVVGGGLGGLAFAISLAKAGANVDVDIYESTSGYGEIGAGISVEPRVWNTLKMMGLEDELQRRSSSLGEEELAYYKGDQAEAVSFGHSTVQLKTYHRAELIEIFELHIPAHYRTRFGKRLVTFEDNSPGPVVLHFKDGTSATCDVLVGADGVKSVVRTTLFDQLSYQEEDPQKCKNYSECREARWTGITVYRALIQRDVLEAQSRDNVVLLSPTYFFGKDKSLITYPVSQGSLINCLFLRYQPDQRGTTYPGPWVSETTEKEILEVYTGWDAQVSSLIKSLEAVPISKWAVNTVEGLPTFVSGRVALVGDAAHAMTPHMAAGSGQSFEDGFILAALLAQPEAQKDNMQQTLKVYDEVRRPFAQRIQDMSFHVGEVYWLETPELKHISAEQSAAGDVPLDVWQAKHEKILDLHHWKWTTSLGADRDSAVEKLKASTNVLSRL